MVIDIHNHITVVLVNIVSVMTSRSFSAYARYHDSICNMNALIIANSSSREKLNVTLHDMKQKLIKFNNSLDKIISEVNFKVHSIVFKNLFIKTECFRIIFCSC